MQLGAFKFWTKSFNLFVPWLWHGVQHLHERSRTLKSFSFHFLKEEIKKLFSLPIDIQIKYILRVRRIIKIKKKSRWGESACKRGIWSIWDWLWRAWKISWACWLYPEFWWYCHRLFWSFHRYLWYVGFIIIIVVLVLVLVIVCDFLSINSS